jgi:SNF2 family DNA or RNA helicase
MTFEAGTSVRSVDNPSRQGVVTNAVRRQKPSGVHVQVRWNDGATDFVHTDELEPLDSLDLSDPFALVRAGRYGRVADLRRNLTFAHLSGRLANLVYSMGITNTEFYAHQYRPLLTLLESPANGLLIADEVGLGKTIEAGLIWTELRARFDLRRLVVVCPAMLREKWRTELRLRFGVDALIVDAAGLLQELSQPSTPSGEGRALIVSYQSVRPPRDWRPNRAEAPQRPGVRWQLADLLHDAAEQDPLIDMVVFDEAHYMRNTETAAWRLGGFLREASSYQLMLSATPINLRNSDLFNLLRLIDPEHFVSEEDFHRLIESNRPLVEARDLVLDRRSSAAQILESLQAAVSEPLLASSHQLAAILKDRPDDQRLKGPAYRAELADALERVNLLSHIITRTRKRDVEERRVKREVQREAVPMTKTERALYEAVTEATRDYALRNGISDGFLLATPQRMITSCPAAIAEAWTRGAAAVQELEEDIESEYLDETDSEAPLASLRETIAALVPRAVDVSDLRRNDSKFRRLMEVAGRFLKQHPSEKIVLFTTYRATARYLADRLSAEGLPARLLMGAQPQTKQEVIDEFRESAKHRVLVSTEVASEGVDLQFCRVLVNYDLPWNPTRVEQRIGRIDRLGQQAELISIWNLYFEATIDERIVSRLLDRLRIFEEALGEAEAIVGETVRRLEADLLSRPLSREEEELRIDQAAQALENLRLRREELERNAAHMMAHGQRVIERIEAARELSRRVTEDDLLVYVQDYLVRYWTGH